MKLQLNTNNSNNLGEKKQSLIKRYLFVSAILIHLVVVILPFLLINIYRVEKPADYSVNMKKVNSAVNRVLAVPEHFIKGKMTRVDPLIMDIKHERLQEIYFQNYKAIEEMKGIFLPEEVDSKYFPVELSYQGKTYKAEAKLKGNWKDARSFEKPSLRFKVSKGDTLFGLKRFSIHNPRVKGSLTEWVFHRMQAYRGNVAMKYFFVPLVINGKNRGVVAVEEHFEKQLVERSKYREGVIVRFSEYWPYYFYLNGSDWETQPHGFSYEVFPIMPVEAFKEEKILESPILSKQYDIARHLLEGFRRGDLKTHEVFDVKKMAEQFAIADLFGHDHALKPRNIKFYYNPITSKLEPIGFDLHSGIFPLPDLVGSGKQFNADFEVLRWKNLFFNDPVFYKAYGEALAMVSESNFLDGFIESIEDEYAKQLNLLYKDNPFFHDETLSILKANRDRIKRYLMPKTAITAYVKKQTDNTLVLDMTNFHRLPIEVLGLARNDVLFQKLDQPILLQAQKKEQLSNYQSVRFKLDAPLESTEKIGVKYRVLGTNIEQIDAIKLVSSYSANWKNSNFIRQKSTVSQFSFLTVSEKLKTIHVQSGNWTISKHLIIPAGYTVKIGAGVQLNLIKGARILSYSPVQFLGTKLKPIRIYSADFSGEGLTVLNAEGRSVLEHVYFSQLLNPIDNGWTLSGSVNFYESDVTFESCRFVYNKRGDDFLNIIRSNFLITRSYFERTFADALDVDFGDGTVEHSRFVKPGNDGVDCSGSLVNVNHVSIELSGDKAVSAGEASTLHLDHVWVKKGNIGITSKDASKVTAKNCSIIGSNIGLAAFQKKPEYGPGFMTVTDTELGELETTHVVEKGSEIRLNGVLLQSEEENVKRYLYGDKYQ